ncbi:MAG: SAP domain-containing protein [Oscillospiraceae bacterium]|nr:SAP domain-containing protein [Oscillospiraceae bacterium]
MGLFDFLKKKKPVQLSSVISFVKQELPNSHAPQYKAPASAFVNKEGVAKTPFVEISVEQDSPPPLSTLLKTATPSKQGLYPHEIMMLEYAPHYKITNNTFQRFWYWQYSVTDPQAVLDSLFQRGFTKVGDLRSALERLTLPEIKDELKLLNQKTTGKKADLIDRLMAFGDPDALDEKYSERYYVLTSKGETELKDNQYVSYLHRNRYMSVWEMNQRIAQTQYPYRDILWGYFNEQAGIHFQNYDFGLYRNVRMNMYRFLMEENKAKTAFHMLCEILSFDLSGLGNSEKWLLEWERSDPKYYLSIYESRIEDFFPYEQSSLTVPPAVSSWFAEMQTILGLGDTEYRDAILNELQGIHPPRRIFTNEECTNIIIAEIRKDLVILSSIYCEAEKREKKRLNEIRSHIF